MSALNHLLRQWRNNFAASKRCLSVFLSSDEKLLVESTQKFCDNVLKPKVLEMDSKGRMDKDIFDAFFKNGWMGMEIPEKYGGSGSPSLHKVLTMETIASYCPSSSVAIGVQTSLTAGLLTRDGSEELKQTYLPKLASNTVGSYCLTEASSGSDAFALKSTATKDGDDYILNGAKMWISSATEAGIFLFFANVDPSAGYRGITCFLVERDTAGVSVAPPEHKLGMRASSTCAVHMDNVRVPASQVVGTVGQGYKCAMDALQGGRICAAAQGVGLAQGCLDYTVAYLKERKQFGQSVWQFQAVQHEAARLEAKIEASRLLTYNAASLRDRGEAAVKEASMAKYFGAETAAEVSNKCVELMGAMGISMELPVQKYYRDAKQLAIYDGTTQIQLNTIAKFIV